MLVIFLMLAIFLMLGLFLDIECRKVLFACLNDEKNRPFNDIQDVRVLRKGTRMQKKK